MFYNTPLLDISSPRSAKIISFWYPLIYRVTTAIHVAPHRHGDTKKQGCTTQWCGKCLSDTRAHLLPTGWVEAASSWRGGTHYKMPGHSTVGLSPLPFFQFWASDSWRGGCWGSQIHWDVEGPTDVVRKVAQSFLHEGKACTGHLPAQLIAFQCATWPHSASMGQCVLCSIKQLKQPPPTPKMVWFQGRVKWFFQSIFLHCCPRNLGRQE